METTVYGYCHKCRDALASPSLLCSSCAAQVEGSASPRQESEQGHAFHTNLSAEDRASFDALMREASRFIQAGTLDPDLTLSEVLAVSLSLAIFGQLEAVRGRVADLEEQIKGL